MGVRNRVEDALLLWKSGRKEGAFLNVLIGVAATSRRRFPGLDDFRLSVPVVRTVLAVPTRAIRQDRF